MAFKQMFFVQVYGIDRKNRIVGGRSYSVSDEGSAKLKAQSLSERVTGVVAFSQMVDDAAQDAEDPVLILALGRVPPEAKAGA